MKSFRMRNIRSFKDTGEIQLKPITIFVGKNSCGKSSLIRFPVVLAQTSGTNINSPLVLNGSTMDYGNFEDILYKKCVSDLGFELNYDIDLSIPEPYMYSYPDFIIKKLRKSGDIKPDPDLHKTTILITLNKPEKHIMVKSIEMKLDNVLIDGFYAIDKEKTKFVLYHQLVDGRLQDTKREYVLTGVNYDAFFPFYDQIEVYKQIVDQHIEIEDFIKVPREDKKQIESRINHFYSSIMRALENSEEIEYDLPEKLETELRIVSNAIRFSSDLMRIVYSAFKGEANAVTYIGPFRNNPERIYRDQESNSRNVGAKGELVSSILLDDYRNNATTFNAVSQWLENTMGYKLKLNDMGGGYFQIMLEDQNGLQSNLMDVGYGISQVLPIITQVIKSSKIKRSNNVQRKDLIIIEQPELHLHPAAQAELADLFVSCLPSNDERSLVIETHSEHMIRKLQVLVADKLSPVTNDMIKIYYVDREKDGTSKMMEMNLLPNGQFEKKWPAGFFDKSYELSMALLRASTKSER